MNAKSSKELKIENATMSVRLMELEHTLASTKSDMAVISAAFVSYIAKTEKIDGKAVYDRLNELIAEKVDQLNKEIRNEQHKQTD